MKAGVTGEILSPAVFGIGDRVRIAARPRTGGHPAPVFLQSMPAQVLEIMEPGPRSPHGRAPTSVMREGGRPSYQVAIPMTSLLPGYVGSPRDQLQVEVPEVWLERD